MTSKCLETLIIAVITILIAVNLIQGLEVKLGEQLNKAASPNVERVRR